MPTLFEQLQARLAGAQAQAPKSQQQSILDAVRSGTGKAGTAAVKQSNLGEQSAIATATQGLQQQQAQGAQAAAQLGEQAAGLKTQDELATEALAAKQRQAEAGLSAQARVQRGELATGEELAGEQREAVSYNKLSAMTQKYDQSLQTLATQRGITTDKLFGNYTREQAKLELEKEGSKLNQALFAATMSNKKYVHELQQVGANRRLGNAQNFQKEAFDLINGKEFASALADIGLEELKDQTAREMETTLTQMDMDQKMTLFSAAARANTRSFWNEGLWGTTIDLSSKGYTAYKKRENE